MKVLVTGANGFVGSAVVEYLRGRGDAVVAATRRSTGSTVGVGELDGTTEWSAALQGVSAKPPVVLPRRTGSTPFCRPIAARFWSGDAHP